MHDELPCLRGETDTILLCNIGPVHCSSGCMSCVFVYVVFMDVLGFVDIGGGFF